MKSLLTLATLPAAIALTVITLTLPLLHWASIPTQPLYQWLAGAAILSLGVCKLTFYPLGLKLWSQRQWLPAFCLLSFATVALCLSIAASRDWLTEQQAQHQQQRQQHHLANNQQAQQQQTALTGINQEITQLLKLIEADTQAGYRKRAIQQQEKLQALKAERAQLSAQPMTAIDNPLNSELGRGLTILNWRLDAALISALALHVGCVLSVLAVTTWKPDIDKGLAGLEKGLDGLNPLNARNDGGLSFDECDLTDDQQALAKRILNGEFGQQFSLKRDLIEAKALRGGHPKIKPVIDFLLSAQRIERRDNQFFISNLHQEGN